MTGMGEEVYTPPRADVDEMVEAARGIKRAEDAKDQGEWVKCHEIMYRAIATLEAAHADA